MMKFLGLVFPLIIIIICFFGLPLLARQSKFNSLGRVTLVVLDKDFVPMIISLEKKNGFFVRLPSKEKITLTRGYGEYEIGKIYPLGELEKKGGLLARESLGDFLKIMISGYFYDPRFNSSLTDLFWRGFWQKNQTDLKRLDLLFLYLKALRIKDVTHYDNWTDVSFKDGFVREEALPVAILNSTEHFGLAQKVADILERGGARVIQIGDAPEKLTHCLIKVVSGKDKTVTLFWLKQLFDCQVEIVGSEMDRADLTLIIGEDYWKKLSEKW